MLRNSPDQSVEGDTIMAYQQNRMLAEMGKPDTVTAEQIRNNPKVQKSRWLQWFVDYDPSADIAATRCPVLALNGAQLTGKPTAAGIYIHGGRKVVVK